MIADKGEVMYKTLPVKKAEMLSSFMVVSAAKPRVSRFTAAGCPGECDVLRSAGAGH